MNKLKLAFKIIVDEAKKRQANGEIPMFLGSRGMLALMHRNIIDFSKHESDQTPYLIDLAVNAFFALASELPDADDLSFDEPEPQENEPSQDGEPSDDNQQTDESNETSDPRWTAVPANTPVPIIPRVREE